MLVGKEWIRTKIVCTIGPSVCSYEKIVELIDAGMNVARLNFSHGSLAQHKEVIDWLKIARKKQNVPLAIMLDTKGPEIRLGKVPGGQIAVSPGDRISLTKQEEEGSICLTPSLVFDLLEKGEKVLFDDGYIASQVVDKIDKGVIVEIMNSGFLKNHKGVNIPGVAVPLPAMTEEDEKGIAFGCQEGVDVIAASFIRSAEHIQAIRGLLMQFGRPDILVVAKIESIQGVENFDAILAVADGIMVARGDLGVELPLHRVPSLQKMMVRKCYSQAKPVITATQMLESMISNPRPTRAEVSDVANAIYDSTSAVMLSGETAVGKYPIQTVQMMRSIIFEAESQFDYLEFFYRDSRISAWDVSSSIALAAVQTAYALSVKGIFVFTTSGATARLMSRFRPKIPIFAITSSEEAYHRMALLWGVVPCLVPGLCTMEEGMKHVRVLAGQHMQPGDPLLVTGGAPFGCKGSTNMMMIIEVEGLEEQSR